jgi:hypothetical protein
MSKFSTVWNQVDEFHELGTAYEAEIKKFKRHISDQDSLNQHLTIQINECKYGQNTS